MIKHHVMRRVHAVHTMRLIARTGSSVVLLTASLYALGREVWVARVFQNMPSPSDLPAAFSFFISAFMGTHVVVQLTILVAIASMVWLLREVWRIVDTQSLHLAY